MIEQGEAIVSELSMDVRQIAHGNSEQRVKNHGLLFQDGSLGVFPLPLENVASRIQFQRLQRRSGDFLKWNRVVRYLAQRFPKVLANEIAQAIQFRQDVLDSGDVETRNSDRFPLHRVNDLTTEHIS